MLTLHRPIGHDRHAEDWIGPAPWIATPPPGPVALLAEARHARMGHSSPNRPYPLVIQRAQGSIVEDVDANRYLDFTAGIANCPIGHCHPQVVRAIRQQSRDLIDAGGGGFRNEPMIALAEKLAQITPGHDAKRVLLTGGGAECITAAIQLARHHTRRGTIVSFEGASHGRTVGRAAPTADKAGEMQPPGPLALTVPYGSVAEIENAIFKHNVPPSEVAAIIVEPLLAEQGCVVPPPEFLLDLRLLCDQHGMVLIVDEIRTGLGRTGRMFCCEHEGLVPDVLLLADGLAGGLPLGAVIARECIMDQPPRDQSVASGANAVSCAAALATIELLEKQAIANTARMYPIVMNKLEQIMHRHKCIAEPRGRGLMVAVEVVKSRRPLQGDPDLRDRIVTEAFGRGLLLMGCGDAGIFLTPPLCINRVQLEVGLDVFEEALATVSL